MWFPAIHALGNALQYTPRTVRFSLELAEKRFNVGHVCSIGAPGAGNSDKRQARMSPVPQPHLRLHSISIFVTDLQASVEFYVDRLGFTIAFDQSFSNGERVVGVAPPEGPTILVLSAPSAGSPDHQRIGKATPVGFVSENIEDTFDSWSLRGVRFRKAPDPIETFGRYASFDDPDGNHFLLFEFDQATRAMEAERRAAQEFEYAKQVQARLFPQSLPSLERLDYAGECLQARHVGGDYYDFLSLGPDRLRLLVADVSGKGMPAALLMANLQANVRSLSGAAGDVPDRLAHSVNRLFYESSVASAYATLFLADYEESTGRLRYVNCGHLPPLILRSDASVESLSATSTVVGLFPTLRTAHSAEAQLHAGDLLVMYTDGVTEAINKAGEEFGEERLIDVLRRCQGDAPASVIGSVIREVKAFSVAEQEDDITLLVAKRIR